MATLIAERGIPPWRRRLTLPAYKVGDAAKYAQISRQTILSWESSSGSKPVVTNRADGASLSYLQLVELAFVAQLRKAGVKLPVIKDAREYVQLQLGSEFPFAQYAFKTDGKDILMKYNNFVAGQPESKLMVANKHQLAWGEILGDKFQEFKYEDGLAVQWHVAGKESPVLIDPRISFGAPMIGGVATWAIKGRWDAGESADDIAEDFSIDRAKVEHALKFEGIDLTELQACSH